MIVASRYGSIATQLQANGARPQAGWYAAKQGLNVAATPAHPRRETSLVVALDFYPSVTDPIRQDSPVRRLPS